MSTLYLTYKDDCNINNTKDKNTSWIKNIFDIMFKKIGNNTDKASQRNENLLTFIKILIDNYDGSIQMKKNILNNKVKFWKIKE